MSKDVNIKQLESLKIFSQDLLHYTEAITNECYSLCKAVMERLSYLQELKAKSQVLVQRIEREYLDYYHYYASNSSRSSTLHGLQTELSRLERRLEKAKMYQRDINASIVVCISMADAIVSMAKKYGNDSKRILESGRIYLSKNIVYIEQYLEKK